MSLLGRENIIYCHHCYRDTDVSNLRCTNCGKLWWTRNGYLEDQRFSLKVWLNEWLAKANMTDESH